MLAWGSCNANGLAERVSLNLASAAAAVGTEHAVIMMMFITIIATG